MPCLLGYDAVDDALHLLDRSYGAAPILGVVLYRFIRRRRARKARMQQQNPRLWERYSLAQEKYYARRAWQDAELTARLAAAKERIDREDAEKARETE